MVVLACVADPGGGERDTRGRSGGGSVSSFAYYVNFNYIIKALT